jgi:PKD repeat protein
VRIFLHGLAGQRLAGVVLMVMFKIIAFSAEIIPTDRRAVWEGNVGVAGGIPARSTIFRTLSPSGGDDTVAIRAALDACPPDQVVKLNTGIFIIGGDMDYSTFNDGVVLRGNGAQNTTLQMNGGGFYVRSQFALPTTKVYLNADAVKGANTVSVSALPSWATIGQVYWISQLDDPAYCRPDGLEGGKCPLYYAGGEMRGMSQLNRLVATTATTMTFEQPMLWGYSTAQGAAIQKGFYNDSEGKSRRMRIGFEDFKIVGNYSNTDDDFFRFEGADSCWVTNVIMTNMPGRAGVYIDGAYRITVSHCYIGYSHSYGAGDGYGVGLYNGSTGCLIENNVFDNLHIGVDLSFSAAGNVIAYNYFGKGGISSGTSPGIASHGHHNWMNLEEGNYSKEPLTLDITHGSGSHFTLFRNRINTTAADTFTSDKTPIVAQYYSRYCNFVANILGSPNFHDGYTSSTGGADYPCNTSKRTLFEIGCGLSPYDTISQSRGLFALNAGYTNGNTTISIIPEGASTSDLRKSYYLTAKPPWYGDCPWPPYGPDIGTTTAHLSQTNIPAGYRYTFGVDPPGTGSAPANQPPVIVASATPRSGIPPLVVNFSSNGSTDPEATSLTYNWNFGDISSSTSANPSHTYNTAGSYIARLTISDGTNSVTSADIEIRVGNQPPVVAATASPTFGAPPLAVTFSSAGTSDPESGTGASSTQANPTYTYTVEGRYVATLTVSDGVNTETSSDLIINVGTQPTPSGLVAAYSFDEGSGSTVNDLSGNGNTGTITAATWTTGKLGGALNFNGSSAMVTVNNSSSLALSSGMTLEAWVYPTALGGWRDVIYKGTQDIYVLMGSSSQANAPSTGGTFASQSVFGTAALPLNTWSHLAGTYDGAALRLYVNGTQVGSRAQSGLIATSSGPLSIGGDLDYSNQFWAGRIDEVRIYNRALTQAEIQSDMGTGSRPSAPQNLRIVSP